MTDIGLAELVAALRSELSDAQEEGVDKALRFRIEDIDLTLQIAATREANGKAGVKFWVVDGEAGGKSVTATTQTLHLKLKVHDGSGDAHDVMLASPEHRRPGPVFG